MIHREERDGIIVLRMEHGKVNAVDTDLCEQLLQHFNDDVDAIVLTGTGSTFSAGVDLMKVLNDGNDYITGFLQALTRALRILFEFPRPVIAAINGHAIAGGCIIACACDYRMMSEGNGKIGVPELQVGVPFPTLAMDIMRFAVPSPHLQTLAFSGQTVGADHALRSGLIDEIVSPEELLDKACAKATHYAAIPRHTFAITKRQLRRPIIDAAKEDPEVMKVWTSPETHANIRTYLDRTLRKR